MRRKEREISKEAALQIADACLWAALSMTEPDGTPYAVPVSIARRETTVYFHCAKNGKKTELLQKNPSVCLTCVSQAVPVPEKYTMAYKSALLFGKASEVTNEAEKTEALKRLVLRYAAEYLDRFEAILSASLESTAVWKIEISQITGKSNPLPSENPEK